LDRGIGLAESFFEATGTVAAQKIDYDRKGKRIAK